MTNYTERERLQHVQDGRAIADKLQAFIDAEGLDSDTAPAVTLALMMMLGARAFAMPVTGTDLVMLLRFACDLYDAALKAQGRQLFDAMQAALRERAMSLSDDEEKKH